MEAQEKTAKQILHRIKIRWLSGQRYSLQFNPLEVKLTYVETSQLICNAI